MTKSEKSNLFTAMTIMIICLAFIAIGVIIGASFNNPQTTIQDDRVWISKKELRKINSQIHEIRKNHDICFIYNNIRKK